MLLVKLTDGVPEKAPITLENFLMLHPNTSFPMYLDAGITEPLGFGVYSYSQVPENINKRTHKAVELLPVRNDEDGVWYQNWEIVPLSEDEKSLVDQRQRMGVISHRNVCLTASDWTQIPDNQLTDEKRAEWRVYRQQLRDLPNAEGFDIWNVEWPISPISQTGVWQAPPDVFV